MKFPGEIFPMHCIGETSDKKNGRSSRQLSHTAEWKNPVSLFYRAAKELTLNILQSQRINDRRFQVTQWRKYEEVAAHLLDRFAAEFNLDRIEGKQTISGQRSGTSWEIDAKGIRDSDGIFMLVECRRYTTSRQSQEKVGGLAYRIFDTGASGGIMISPLGLQEGGRRVALAENIIEVILHEHSTAKDFVMHFFDKLLVGVSSHLRLSDGVAVELVRNPHDISGC